MKDGKFYIVSGLSVLISVFIILFVWIKFVDLTFTEKFNKEVMLASIGLVGALVGGAISGLLTLIGVKITIKENHDKDFNESLPEKIMFAEDITTVLERQLKLIDKIDGKYDESSEKKQQYRSRLGYIVEYLEEDGMLVKSSKVNLATYRSTRNLCDYLKMVIFENKLDHFPYKEIRENLVVCIEEVRNENNKFLKKANIYK